MPILPGFVQENPELTRGKSRPEVLKMMPGKNNPFAGFSGFYKQNACLFINTVATF
jgi:hypothetical protein